MCFVFWLCNQFKLNSTCTAAAAAGFLIFFSLCLISLVFAVSLLQIKTRHETTYSASNLNTTCKSKLGSFVKHSLWQEQAVTEQATLMSFFLQTTPERPKRQRLLWLPRSSSTTVLNRCRTCQWLQSSKAIWSQVSTVLDEHQKTSGSEVVKDTQSIDFVHLVQSPSPSRLWTWILAILPQDFLPPKVTTPWLIF